MFSALVSTTGVHATTGDSWVDMQLQKVAEMPVSGVSFLGTMCPAALAPIQVEGISELVEGCVFGKEGDTRMAMYLHNSIYSYAIAGVTDSAFIPITNFCEHTYWCVYSQSENTALLYTMITPTTTGHAVIKNFTDYLVLYEGEHRYYQFEYPENLQYLKTGNSNLRTGSVGISSNGHWAVLELRSYGFVRMDMRTQEVRRITAPGPTYGHGFDPTYELAISDDGRRVAFAGSNVGFRVLEVTDGCGDTTAAGMTQYFAESITACPFIPLETYDVFPGYRLANMPRFSAGGDSISAYVSTATDTVFARLMPNGGSSLPGSGEIGRYIAFGDSFTSGEGELSDAFYLPGTNTPTNRCHVSVRSYPYLVQNYWQVMASNLACSGSRTNEVQKALKVAVDDATQQQPVALSLSIGGNNVGLMGKLSTCVQPGTCEWADPERRIATAHEIRGLLEPLAALIGEIRSEYAGTPLFIVGYPKIINDTSSVSCGLVLLSLLSTDERIYMNQSISYLNQVIRAAANYTNVRFVDVEHVFEGERLCDDSSKAMNGIRYGDDIAPIPFIKTKFIGAESFHPTPYGHSLVAQAVYAQLGDSFIQDGGCYTCRFDASMLETPSYWTSAPETNWSAVRQLTQTFITDNQLIDGAKVAFEFIADTFAPNQTVTLELHSDAISLGAFSANANGSLTGEVTLPKGVTGYHTIHSLGESATGDSLDIYQTVFIGEYSTQVAEPGVPGSSGGIGDESDATGGVLLRSNEESHSNSSQVSSAIAYRAPHEPSVISLAIPASTPATSLQSSVLGTTDSISESSNDELRLGGGYESILITYGILAAVSALGIGCLYWYIRIKSAEVD
ncbi:MAG: SGNH/GDSL hydrolase family protein [Candidatus Microsaccharimonas sp.]